MEQRTNAFLKSYTAACDSANSLPVQAIVEELSCCGQREDGGARAFALSGSSEALRTRRIDDAHLRILLPPMLASDFVSRLDLCYNRIGDDGAVLLANYIRESKVLQELLVVGNDFGDHGAAAIASGLASNNTLRDLDLGVNEIGAGIGGMAVAGALQINRTLHRLGFARCRLTQRSLVALFMIAGESLKYLDVGGNPAPEITAHIARMLERRCALVELRLAHMMLDDSCISVHLAPALARCELEVLDLRSNRIMRDGAVALAQMLELNTALRTLLLDHNSIDDAGADALGAAIRVNRTLRILGLGSNAIGESGLVSLAASVLARAGPIPRKDAAAGMQAITLWGNKFGARACLAWRDLVDDHEAVECCDFVVRAYVAPGAASCQNDPEALLYVARAVSISPATLN